MIQEMRLIVGLSSSFLVMVSSQHSGISVQLLIVHCDIERSIARSSENGEWASSIQHPATSKA
jgi:hypothetical protein